MHASKFLAPLKRWMAVGLLASGAIGSTQAADPVAGSARFPLDCARSGCHNTADPLITNASKIWNGRNAASVISNAIAGNTGGMGMLSSNNPPYTSGSAAVANMAAYLGNSPATLTFASTAVGSTSAAQTVTVKASTRLATNSIVVSTTGDFARAGGTCTTTLGVGGTCTVLVAFTPSAAGTRTGTLSIAHSGIPGNPVLFALSGTATGGAPAPAASASPTSVTFGSTVIGTPSAASTVTLSNPGTAALSLTSLSATGDFSVASGGSCSAAGSVSAGASCTANVVFTPAAIGPRTGTLTFAHNAGTGSTVVSLSGTGANAPAPAVTLSPASVAFGSQQINVASSARPITLTNSGNAALTISSIGLAAPFSGAHNCPLSPSTLAPNTSCTINAVFNPTATGPAGANLTITTDAAGSPHSVALTGTGSPAPVAVLSWSTASLTLPSSPTGTASPTTQSAILTNQGPGSVTLSSLSFSGTNASEFSLGTGTTCAASTVLAASATCNVVVGFTPAATGVRSASLLVTSNGSNPPALALSGTGTAPATAQLTVLPSAVSISAAPSSMGQQTLTIGNSGTAPLNITQITVGSGPFTIQPPTTGGCPAGAFTLAPNSSCDVTVLWTNTSTTSDTGTVQIVGSTGVLQTIGATAQRASAQAVQPPPALEMQNQGGGGCSISRGQTPFDPVLGLLLALAGAVLWRRRRTR